MDKPFSDTTNESIITVDNALEENYHAQLSKEIIRLTNVERDKEGLNALISHDSLGIVAIDKAVDMAENNYFIISNDLWQSV